MPPDTMRLTFLGATGTVTGSKFLVAASTRRILVDALRHRIEEELEWACRVPEYREVARLA